MWIERSLAIDGWRSKMQLPAQSGAFHPNRPIVWLIRMPETPTLTDEHADETPSNLGGFHKLLTVSENEELSITCYDAFVPWKKSDS